jgi:hypothetical protein
MFLGKIERDRQGLPQRKAFVVDCGQPAVGVDRKILGLARARFADLDRDVLVGKAELLGDPEHAKGAGAGNPIDAQLRHLFCSEALTTAPR